MTYTTWIALIRADSDNSAVTHYKPGRSGLFLDDLVEQSRPTVLNASLAPSTKLQWDAVVPIYPLSLPVYGSRSVLAVKGSLRRAQGAPWTAPGRSEAVI